MLIIQNTPLSIWEIEAIERELAWNSIPKQYEILLSRPSNVPSPPSCHPWGERQAYIRLYSRISARLVRLTVRIKHDAGTRGRINLGSRYLGWISINLFDSRKSFHYSPQLRGLIRCRARHAGWGLIRNSRRAIKVPGSRYRRLKVPPLDFSPIFIPALFVPSFFPHSTARRIETS